MAQSATSNIQISVQATDRSSLVSPSTSTELMLSSKRTQPRQFSEDEITINAPDGIDSLLDERALNSNLPEIVGLFDFVPTSMTRTNSTTASQLINLKASIQMLLQEDNAAFIEELRNDKAYASSIEALGVEYDEVAGDTLAIINDLSDIVSKINTMKSAFNILDSKSLRQSIDAIRANRFDGGLNASSLESIKDVLVNSSGFTRENTDGFSNTRALAQIISDLRTTLTKFSPVLLGAYNDSRINDSDPVTINKTSSVNDDFEFTAASISSNSFDITSASTYQNTQYLLPADNIDTIKVMIATLSREIRMSVGLENLDQDYEDILAQVIGEQGSKITDNVSEAGTLSDLLQIRDENGNIVLPFESRLIVDGNQTYIPGSVFLVDSILRGDNSFETDALNEYAQKVSELSTTFYSTFNTLLNFGDEKRTGFNDTILKRFLSTIANSISTLGTQVPNAEEALGIALLGSCKEDADLKYVLFDYFASIYNNDDYASSDIIDAVENATRTNGLAVADVFGKLGASLAASSNKSSPILSNNLSGLTTINVSKTSQLSKTISSIAGTSTEESGNVAIVGVNTTPSIILGKIRSIALLRGSNRVLGAVEGASPNSVEIDGDAVQTIISSVYSSPDFIFLKLVDLAREILGNESMWNDVSTTRTSRYNNMTENSLLFLMFETLVALVDEYIPVEISSVTEADSVVIGYNSTSIESTRIKMLELIGEQPFVQIFNTNSVSSDESSISSLLTTLTLEDSHIQDMIDIIKSTANSVVSTANDVVNYFSTQTSNVRTALENFLGNEVASEIIQNITSLQVVLARRAYEEIMTISNSALISNANFMSLNKVNALLSMLREPEFTAPEGDNLRIMLVGLPTGLQSALKNSKFIVGIDESIAIEDSNFITVKVYRTDPEFAEIIFKPQTFVFDMMCFADNTFLPTTPTGEFSLNTSRTSFATSTTISDDTIFDDVLKTGMSCKYITPDGMSSTSFNKEQFINSESNSGLTESEAYKIYRNHIVSALFRQYIQLMTGMDASEYSFLASEGIVGETSTIVKEIMINLLANNSLSQASSRKSTIFTAADDVSKIFSWRDDLDNETVNRFRRFMSSIFIDKETHRAQTLQTKMFERIFLIPIDPNNFEIDVEATIATESGSRIWALESVQNEIEKRTSLSPGMQVLGSTTNAAIYTLKSRDAEFTQLNVVIELGANF